MPGVDHASVGYSDGLVRTRSIPAQARTGRINIQTLINALALMTVALGQLNLSNVPIHLREFSLAVESLVEVELRVACAGFAEIGNQPSAGMPDVSYQGLISLYPLIQR
jgi:hypothetical protein